jgi:RNA polymerase sigma-70 factor (ECF subfamily)
LNHKELIQLYFNRDEQASVETYRQFGGYCYTIANNILGNAQDAEECVNDVMIRLWERIPPNRPDNFYGYITVLTRRIACTRFNAARAKKRGGGEATVAFDELDECAGNDSVDEQIDRMALGESLNTFLGTLKPDHRAIFMQRYWYFCTVEEIAKNLHLTKSKVTVTLMRTRTKLRKYLEEEGFL